jgi:hypothetical protein
MDVNAGDGFLVLWNQKIPYKQSPTLKCYGDMADLNLKGLLKKLNKIIKVLPDKICE